MVQGWARYFYPALVVKSDRSQLHESLGSNAGSHGLENIYTRRQWFHCNKVPSLGDPADPYHAARSIADVQLTIGQGCWHLEAQNIADRVGDNYLRDRDRHIIHTYRVAETCGATVGRSHPHATRAIERKREYLIPWQF